MTDFDPDAYLHSSDSSTSFDPDAYLSQSAPASAPSTPSTVYDADLFRKRVGRDPSPAELANFKQFQGQGWSTGNSGGSFKGMGEAALATGAGTLRAISGAANDILPDSQSGRARLAAEIAQDPILNYRGGPEAQQYLKGINTALSPVTWAANKIHQGIAAVAGDRAADVAGDVATLLPAARGTINLRGMGGRLINSMQDPEALSGASTSEPGGTGGSATELSVTNVPRGTPFEVPDVPGHPGVLIDSEPVEGGLPNAAANQRAQILSRVGLENARSSALEGNAQNAATDWQLSKFDEPAGVAAKAQFDAERTALRQHSENLVQRTGGTLGTDEDTLNQRGQTMARPFEALQDWFEQQRQNLYSVADERSGGHPVVQPASLRTILDDPSFQNQLTARDQINLRNGISAELDRFQRNNPNGLTVQNSEQFRQFLNSIWKPETSQILGRLKGALDNDVMAGAGEDIYGAARRMAQIEHQTLQNPSGIHQIMERDPQTPINRTTPYEKIPDTIVRLPTAQFDNVMRTLDAMPDEIQPLAQQAKAEIKAHLANKINDAGTSTQGQWNARAVEKVIRGNSAKLQSAFQDQPDVLQGIQDLRSAGNILSVNQGYPGAAAQASNALKRGFMSRALTQVAGAAGGGIGGYVAGPMGAAVGAAGAEVLGSRLGASASERAAVRNWNQGIRPLTPAGPPQR
jgi:hypothetical protein